MFKRFTIILLFIFMFANLNAASVSVDVDIYSDFSIFDYTFSFDETESYRSFSFEKPKGAKLVSINSKNLDVVKYSVAGDYFIVNPKSVKNDTFKIQFTSNKASSNIYEKNSFEVYSNFNFLVDELVFNVDLLENVGSIETFFPRDYSVLDDGSFQWKLINVDREELFRLEFSEIFSKEDIQNNKFWTDNLIIIVSGVVLLSALVLIVLMFIFSSKFRMFNIKISLNKKHDVKPSKSNKVKLIENKKEISENLDDGDLSNDKVSSEDIEILTESSAEVESKKSGFNEVEFREVMARFLTENEKLVVSCVKENDGIAQYDILNFLPKLTKSNLSKIISKLDNKKILKRIRVGKVNKIYLGNRFDIKESEDLK